MTINEREAQFLASQASRTAERDQRRQQQGDDDSDANYGRQRGKQRDVFWVNFRSACTELNQQMDELLVGGDKKYTKEEREVSDADLPQTTMASLETTEGMYITAAQRNKAKTKIDSISSQLRLMQKHCLAPSSSSSSPTNEYGSQNKNLSSSSLLLLQTQIPELPPADLRLMSEEITKLSDKIDSIRDIICPKEKFSFRRYRAALSKQQQRKEEKKKNGRTIQQDIEPASLAAAATTEREDSKKDMNIAQYEGIVEYISDSSVIVQADGKVCVTHRHSHDNLAAKTSTETTTAKEASSFLMRNMKNCNVVLNGTYKSVHFIKVEKCNIDIKTPILQGSVHVTSCYHTKLSCASNQLRIHDSSDVEFHVFVQSGPIIEDCCNIQFYGDYFMNHDCPWQEEDEKTKRINRFRDVKDFNWLRTLVPSPNFKIVQESIIVPASAAVNDGKARNVPMAGNCGNTVNIEDVPTKKPEDVAGNDEINDGNTSSDDEDEL